MGRICLRLLGDRLRIEPTAIDIGPVGRPTALPPLDRLLQSWEKKNGLVQLYPGKDEGEWWKGARYRFVVALAELVQVHRLLTRVLSKLPESPRQVVIRGGAESAATTATALASALLWPSAAITIRDSSKGIGAALYRTRRAIGLKRRRLGLKRLAKMGPHSGRLRVALMESEVQWTGGRDKDLWSVERALRAHGVEVVALVSPCQDWQKNVAGLKERPANHIFTDQLRPKSKPQRPVPPSRGSMGPFRFEGRDFTPFVRWWMARAAPEHEFAPLDDKWYGLMARLRPDVLVTAHEHYDDGLVRRLAKKFGCKLGVVQHGVITDYHPLYIFPKMARGRVMMPWRQFVYSEVEAKILVRRSIYDRRKIRVVGSPEWDGLRDGPFARRRNEALSERKFLFHDPIRILFTSQPGLREDLLRQLFDGISRSFPRAELRIRLHPRERTGGHWSGPARRYRNGNVRFSRNGRLDTDLFWADVHLSFTSSCIFHAVMAGVPTVLVGNYGESWRKEFLAKGLAVDAAQGVGKAIKLWRKAGALERFEAGRAHYLKASGIPPGRAGERIAQELILASKSPERDRSFPA